MTDAFEKRAQEAISTHSSPSHDLGEQFIADARWARAEMESEIEHLKGELDTHRNASVVEHLKAEIDRLKAELQEHEDSWKSIQDTELYDPNVANKVVIDASEIERLKEELENTARPLYWVNRAKELEAELGRAKEQSNFWQQKEREMCSLVNRSLNERDELKAELERVKDNLIAHGKAFQAHTDTIIRLSDELERALEFGGGDTARAVLAKYRGSK